ncbi:MAG: PIN domain-containing protein [Bacillota bacterium]|nr:PIN domain-containing protein [Bacillota bacterium]
MRQREGKQSAWLDTNVILRFLLHDHEEYFLATCKVFEQAAKGELTLLIHPLTMAELVWTLDSFYNYSKTEIVYTLENLMDAEGINMPEKEITKKALRDYEEKNVDFIDAYLASYAFHRGPHTIYTLDKKHFSRLDGEIIFPDDK